MQPAERAPFFTRKTLVVMLLCVIGSVVAVILAAPALNPHLGPQTAFGAHHPIIAKWFGASGGKAVAKAFDIIVATAGVALAVIFYENMDTGVARLPHERRTAAASRGLRQAARRAACLLFAREGAVTTRDERIGATVGALFFLVLYAILMSKNAAYLSHLIDLHWHRPFLDYDIDWGTPLFSLAGDVLYHFDMQIPFNTELAPMNGLAHLFPPRFRIVAAFTGFYLAMGGVMWAVGTAARLRPVARAVFAGTTSLIVTVPFRVDSLLPFVPPVDFLSQAMLTSYWEEVSILALATAVLFFWIGQHKSAAANLAVSLGFALCCCDTLLAYPATAFFASPIIAFYCLTFLATASRPRELRWKVGVSVVLLAGMVAARLPLFFKNLYSFGLGAYFIDRLLGHPWEILKNATIPGVFSYDLRVPILCVIAYGTAVFFIARRHGALRRFGIALLVCEAGIFAMGAVFAYFAIPQSLYYMDQMQAAILVGYFVLPLLFLALAILVRADEILERLCAEAKAAGIGRAILAHRRALAPLAVLAYSLFLVPTEPPDDYSNYPPAQPPSVQFLQKELALAPGKPFSGRALTLVQQNFPSTGTTGFGPLWVAVVDTLDAHYGHITGNDHWLDLSSLDIPVVGEYAEWTTPVNFVFLHRFFMPKNDAFNKALFVLRRWDARAARMIGVRYVVSDATSLPGTTQVYERMAGDTPLRIFRVDGTNLGQFSPTHLLRYSSADEALDAIANPAFDPERDALVEEDPPANLVPANFRSLTVEAGPALHVVAQSAGTSLLVLPFEFSHCLRLRVVGGGAAARLMPVNLQQTGLIFDGSVDATITYEFGPFDQPACRGADLARADRLHLADAL